MGGGGRGVGGEGSVPTMNVAASKFFFLTIQKEQVMTSPPF